MHGDLRAPGLADGDDDEEDSQVENTEVHSPPATWSNMLELCSQRMIFIFWVQNVRDQCLQ